MKCQICNNDKWSPGYRVCEMMLGTRDVFDYFKCSDCGCLQIKQIPNTVEQYYEKDYYSYHSPGYSKRSIVKRITNWYLKMLLKYGVSFFGPLDEVLPACRIFKAISFAAPNKSTRILDVGCGSGESLWFLREFGFTNLLGVDPYIARDISYPNGLVVRKSEVFNVAGQWDIIMFNHSFEHIHNPLETLQKVSSCLSDSGVCIVRVPVVDSYAWRRFGVHWMHLDAPRHFYLYTVKSMQHLTSKVGLSIDAVRYDSDSSQFWGSKCYRRNISLNELKTGWLPGLLKRFYYAPYVMYLNLTQQGDWAIFYLSKEYSVQ